MVPTIKSKFLVCLVSLLAFLSLGNRVVNRGGAGVETAFLLGPTSDGVLEVNGGEYGYKFTTTTAITITQLGTRRVTQTYTDLTIKLFGSDGTTELASIAVDYDSVSVGDMVYTSITPIAVGSGQVRHIRIVGAGFNGFQAGTYSGFTNTAVATIDSASDETGASGGSAGYADFKYTAP